VTAGKGRPTSFSSLRKEGKKRSKRRANLTKGGEGGEGLRVPPQMYVKKKGKGKTKAGGPFPAASVLREKKKEEWKGTGTKHAQKKGGIGRDKLCHIGKRGDRGKEKERIFSSSNYLP